MKTHTLSSGLKIVAIENKSVPLVTLDMWVRVGSKDEPAEIAGISHFLEHMLFKGTPRLGVGEYDRRIEEIGGYLNAATSTDYTHYYLTVPSEHLDRALVDMADVLINSTFDPHEVEKERGVVLEEMRMKQDNPTGFLYDEITRRMYRSGPYAGTVIGSAETVSAITRDQIAEHHRRFYAPENMAFVVAGDFDRDAIVKRCEELFGAFRPKLDPWREAVPATEFAPPANETFERDWRQTYFFLTFPGDGVQSVKTAAIDDVTQQLLTGGRTSRLVNALREKKRLVSSISAWSPSNVHPGFWAVYGTCEADKLAEVQDAIFAEIDDMIGGGIAADELRRAKRQLVTDHLYQTETNTGKASVAGYSFALFGDAGALNDYPSAIEHVSERQVVEVLKTLSRDRMGIYSTKPAAATAAPAGAPK